MAPQPVPDREPGQPEQLLTEVHLGHGQVHRHRLVGVRQDHESGLSLLRAMDSALTQAGIGWLFTAIMVGCQPGSGYAVWVCQRSRPVYPLSPNS
jgi:hypothetical protein